MEVEIGDNVSVEVDAVGVALRTKRATIYMDQETVERFFIYAVRQRLIDAQQIMSEVYDR
jgi:hypothetical protein